LHKIQGPNIGHDLAGKNIHAPFSLPETENLKQNQSLEKDATCNTTLKALQKINGIRACLPVLGVIGDGI